MSCYELDRYIPDYLECKISVDDLASFYLHLCECEDCRCYLTQYRRVVLLLRQQRRCA